MKTDSTSFTIDNFYNFFYVCCDYTNITIHVICVIHVISDRYTSNQTETQVQDSVRNRFFKVCMTSPQISTKI